MTKVVHCKKEPYDVKIDRSTEFGNPYSHKEGTLAKYKVHSRKEAIQKFKEMLYSDKDFQKRILPLKDKTLGCWCRPEKACHGDVIAEFLDRETKIENLFKEG